MAIKRLAYLRKLTGVFIKDMLRYQRSLGKANGSYLTLCNRNELLEPAPDGSGYRCDWQWASDLHAPKVLPVLGRWLMKRALADHPIRRLPQPEQRSGNPEVSFTIGHRSMARLPHLLLTLESIAGQQGVGIECIVVEQETEAQLAGHLPSWVRHIHTPPPAADMPYCRSWAFNVGVQHARGELLVLHDNDMLVPADYAARLLERVDAGYDVVNLKRFIFYLSSAHTEAYFAGHAGLFDQPPEAITQNLEAGGSVAITAAAYDRIGGMDESFIGWGGEDNEFWERAQTLKVWPYGCLPLVHLWHPVQPGKPAHAGFINYAKTTLIDPQHRISRLCKVQSGASSGPTGWSE